MKLIFAAIILSLCTLVPVSGQSGIVGTWQIHDEDEIEDSSGEDFGDLWQFRADGILLFNEYSDGDLECVFAFPYEVNGDRVTIGEGLNWEYDADSGEFELYEEFSEDHFAFSAALSIAGDRLSLAISNGSILRGFVAEMQEDAEFVPADLELDYDFDDVDLMISDEELVAALERIFVVGLVGLFEAVTELELNVDLDLDPEDALDALAVAVVIAELEEALGVEVEDLETELGGEADEVLATIFVELGIPAKRGGRFDPGRTADDYRSTRSVRRIFRRRTPRRRNGCVRTVARGFSRSGVCPQ